MFWFRFLLTQLTDRSPKRQKHTHTADASTHPTAGLNFDNFVDCIARLGLVGLARGTWSEMFPTTTERAEAIFLTTMGCLDNSVVSAHLHQHKKSQGLATSEYKGMTALTREHSLKGYEEEKRKAKQVRVGCGWRLGGRGIFF